MATISAAVAAHVNALLLLLHLQSPGHNSAAAATAAASSFSIHHSSPRRRGTPPSGRQPCDIYAAAGTSCVAAHSVTRALYSAYHGPLYRVCRQSDNLTSAVGTLEPGGYADAATQNTFCAGTSCVIDLIFDQSERGNHLHIGVGGDVATGPGGRASPDFGVNASRLPLSVGGHSVFGAYFEAGMGYRTDNLDNVPCPGVARGNEPETVYMVASGKHFSGACCFD